MTTQDKTIIFRDYQPGDEYWILALFREVFHKEMSYAFWKWRYLDNPYGQAISRLALDGERVVGHFAVLPMKVQFEGKLYRAIFPVTAMTHPDYGGRGIFTRLITETYDLVREKGYTLAYGFFNQNSYYVSVYRVGYAESDVTRMSTLEKRIAPSTRFKVDGAIKEVNSFDARSDRLWVRVKGDFKAVVPRTQKYLNWRFARYEEIDYPKFVLNSGDDIVGYVVLKIYGEGNTVRGHIIDLLCIPDEKVVKSLIERAYAFFAERGVPDITCWMMEGSFYSYVLEKEGFTRKEGLTNFGALLLDRSREELISVQKPASWHLTMGDSDVF